MPDYQNLPTSNSKERNLHQNGDHGYSLDDEVSLDWSMLLLPKKGKVVNVFYGCAFNNIKQGN